MDAVHHSGSTSEKLGTFARPKFLACPLVRENSLQKFVHRPRAFKSCQPSDKLAQIQVPAAISEIDPTAPLNDKANSSMHKASGDFGIRFRSRPEPLQQILDTTYRQRPAEIIALNLVAALLPQYV